MARIGASATGLAVHGSDMDICFSLNLDHYSEDTMVKKNNVQHLAQCQDFIVLGTDSAKSQSCSNIDAT